MTSQSKIKIVLFSGGSGTLTITDSLLKHPQISLTILVNAYDDGLSTGELRKFIPGMLGPSDVRKNIIQCIPKTDQCYTALRFLMNYRFPIKVATETVLNVLHNFIEHNVDDISISELSSHYWNLNIKQAFNIGKYSEAFLEYYLDRKYNGLNLNFKDFSMGNILFTGCYLNYDQDFNLATEKFNLFCETKAKTLNISTGECYVLVGVKADGEFLPNEESIVSPQSPSPISEIFLIEDYLSSEEIDSINPSSKENIIEYIKSLEKFPNLNSKAQLAIELADVIIYGPGTQYSSLFPTYLTKGLIECIESNKKAQKIFIANITKDFDIQSESTNSLIDNFFYYMSRKSKLKINPDDTISRFFIQDESALIDDSGDYVSFDFSRFRFSSDKLVWKDWEATKGKHLGGRFVEELLAIIRDTMQQILKPYHHTVSIIIPVLNEEKTVKQVLHSIRLLDFGSFELEKEVILVDGLSVDSSYDLAKSEEGVRVFQLDEKNTGRGAALKLGIQKSKGDIIVFFPSDGEYDPNDIFSIVAPIVNQEFDVVFGSRAFKTQNLSKRILDIYDGRRIPYIISKYGGILLSMVTLLLYNKYVSDTLTSIKGFKSSILKDMSLTSDGFDMDMEIIAKVSRGGHFILEVPVEYRPRTKKDGKKISMFDGIQSLKALIKYRFSH